MENFYDELVSFKDFHKLASDQHYRPLPEDWDIVISDIRGSTKAIENGRYQDVNTLGAASIAVVQAKFLGRQIPFVFGGDGASFLIPHSALASVKEALIGLRQFALANYAMEMRVGAVSMRELLAHHQQIEVAKFELAAGKSIALIRGGGLSFAESLIKKHPDKYCFNVAQNESLKELAAYLVGGVHWLHKKAPCSLCW